MNNSGPKEPAEYQYLDIMQNIEAAITAVYRSDPALTDFEVDSAIDALMKAYQGEAIGKPVRLPHSPRSQQVYAAVRDVCEFRLGRSAAPEGSRVPDNQTLISISVEVIPTLLKRVRKSIDLWTKEGGRQGYLFYISQFIQ